MTGTTKKAKSKVVRLAGVALIAALAGGGAMAGSERFVVAAYESSFVAALTLDGCAPSTQSRTCTTTARVMSGPAAGLPCEVNVAYLNGSSASGACSLGWADRAGSARVKVSNASCDRIVVRDPRQSRITLVDGKGVAWRVVDLRLDATDYVHRHLDHWTLKKVSGLTESRGSYVKAVNGNQTLTAWLNGTMTALFGYCYADAGSGSFTVTGVAQGWIVQ